MPEGNIERGSGKRERDTEIESTVERPDAVVPEVQEVRHEEPEKWVREAAEDLEAKEHSEVGEPEESSDVAKWVEQTAREVVENEDASSEGKERAERLAREIAEEVVDNEIEGEAEPEAAATDESSSKPWEIRSEDELNASLERHSDLREEEDFESLYEDAVEYCRAEDREGVRPPELVRELEYRDLKELYEEANGDVSDGVAEAAEEETGEKIETSAEATADMTVPVDEAAEVKTEQVGMEIDDETRRVEDTPGDEVHTTDDAERASIDPEAPATEETEQIEKTAPERGLHHINDEVVREAVEPLKEVAEPTAEDIADAIEHMVRSDPADGCRIHCADVRHVLDAREAEVLEKGLRDNKAEVEGQLTQSLRETLEHSERYQVAMVEGRLYIRRVDENPTRLENAYGNLYYYFESKAEFEKYISDVGKALGLEGQSQAEIERHLHQMVSQMLTDPTDNHCINPEICRIRGDHVHLMNDLAGTEMKDLEGQISKLTKASGRGGIMNPRFPERAQFEVALSKLTGIAVTDCHLKPNGTLEYSEKEISRIRIVEEDLQLLGDINLNPKLRDNENLYDCYLPTPLGEALKHLGIPPGDRTVQNPGLYHEIKEFSPEAKLALLGEVIPQDGTISGVRVQWTHTNVLDAAGKSEIYDVSPKVGQREINLIIDQGNKEEHGWVLNYGKLRELLTNESRDIRETSRSMWDVVYENPNRLVQDGVSLLKEFGIEYNEKPYTIRYHGRTGRVSVAWTAEPNELIDSIKLSMLAPANDEIKRESMKEIISSHPKIVQKAMDQFLERGIDVEEWWKS